MSNYTSHKNMNYSFWSIDGQILEKPDALYSKINDCWEILFRSCIAEVLLEDCLIAYQISTVTDSE